MGVRYNGVRYRDGRGSPDLLADKDGNEAPPEAYEKSARKAMMRAGI